VGDVAKRFQPALSVSDALEHFPDDDVEYVHFLIIAEKRAGDSQSEGYNEQRDFVPEFPLDIMKRGMSWIPT
jgi:hypothetical protein